MKFDVGDRVRVKNEDIESLKDYKYYKGKIGEVIYTHNADLKYPIKVRFETPVGGERESSFAEHELELNIIISETSKALNDIYMEMTNGGKEIINDGVDRNKEKN